MYTCPCGSGREFQLCCGPLLAGQPAPTAEALMRSRYTAYTTGDLDYIQHTCAGEAALGFDRDEAARSMADTEWLGLAIAATTAGTEADTTGTVTFTARFRQHGRVSTLSETSRFRRVMGAWRYVGGEMAVAAVGPKAMGQVGRNDPCPCGSGRKYKKCCGAG